MPGECISLTREELYEDVWSEPIVHVAKRLGLSDRGLGKVCARHNVPVPPRGWWAKRQHGHAVRRIPLPSRVGSAAEITFHPADCAPQSSEPIEVTREKHEEWLIAVPTDLTISHPLARRAAAALRTASRGVQKNRFVRWQDRYQAKLVKPGAGHLDIAVSKASISRALRIMQTLLAAFERRGFAVHISENNETFVDVLEERFQIALVERMKQVTVKHSYGSGIDLEPSGRLTLRIGSAHSNAGVSDSASRQVEQSLNRFVLNLVRRGLEKKRERAAHAQREARWRVHDQESRHLQQLRDAEKIRRRRLASAVVRWTQHQRRLAFVESVEERLLDGPLDIERTSADRWLEWATEFLKASDPIGEFLTDPWPIAPLRAEAPMPWNWE